MPATALPRILSPTGKDTQATDPDRVLVTQAAAGKREAFDELVTRYRRHVYRLARTMAGNDSDIDDLVQDTFVRAFRAIPRFRGDSAFKSWLHRIAANVVQDHLVRRGRRQNVTHTLSHVSARELEEIVVCDDLELTMMRRQAIQRALDALAPELRLLVQLRDIEGLKYEEIARIVDLPRGTVDSRLFRARQLLRPMLETFLAEPVYAGAHLQKKSG